MKYWFLISSIFFFSLISCKENETNKNIDKKQFDESLIKINKYLLKEDAERIESYIKRRNWSMKMTETGMFYEIYQQGAGEKSTEGKIVKLKFRVELLDGTVCYSSDSSGDKRFRIGQGNVESGLEQGLLLLHEGDKARFIMPPYMAHGLIGDLVKIPPRSIIVYDVEVLKISDY